jgi:hypothetical protein
MSIDLHIESLILPHGTRVSREALEAAIADALERRVREHGLPPALGQSDSLSVAPWRSSPGGSAFGGQDSTAALANQLASAIYASVGDSLGGRDVGSSASDLGNRSGG